MGIIVKPPEWSSGAVPTVGLEGDEILHIHLGRAISNDIQSGQVLTLHRCWFAGGTHTGGGVTQHVVHYVVTAGVIVEGGNIF